MRRDCHKAVTTRSFADIRSTIAAHFDADAAIAALLRFKKVMDAANVPFFLLFGTLLGAYRDKKFIEYDTDVDVGITPHQISPLLTSIQGMKFALEELLVVRQDEALLSFEFQGLIYIDIYAFWPCETGYSSGSYKLTKEQLNPIGTIEFLETTFNCPSNPEVYLEQKYGPEWRTPTPNRHAGT